MRLTEIYLQNFRIFHELKLGGANEYDAPINPRMNVIIGDNGAGKSAILGAISSLASNYAYTLSKDRKIKYQLSNLDINNDEDDLLIEANFEYEGWGESKTGSWKMGIQRERLGKKRKPKFKVMENSNNGNSYDENDLSYRNFPVVMHYGVERSALEVPERNRSDNNYPQEIQYFEMLNSKSNFRQFYQWFEDMENIENQLFRYKNFRDSLNMHAHEGEHPAVIRLRAVRCAVEKFLGNFTNLRVDRSHGKAFLIDKQDRPYNIEQLSQGERNLITLVGDIGKNLSIMYPRSSAPLEEAAVVLIDEIDMHLHPSWQVDILDKLMETFPQCQFFVTTHSPLVISTANKNINIIRLEGGRVRVITENLRGWSAEKVLKSAMKAPYMEYEILESIEKVERLIEKERISEAKEAFESIKHLKNGKNSEVNRVASLLEEREMLIELGNLMLGE
ncbi:AAA family ATPase [Rothia nasimurium]|uniref:AAA family ATPase n=1 Tax=Rothia nasimurium TaxID=85336 RepID=UPI001F00B566|nr:AAA family ATPase [Rothia nasimurium]